MALIHEFIVISKQKHSSFDFSNIRRDTYGKIILENSKLIDVVEISDSLVTYFMDFFNWIPTSSSLCANKSKGLNYHGITYIANEDGILFGKIFRSLAELFSVAPEILKLKGEFCWEEDSLDTGRYEIITLERESVLQILRKLVTWSEYMQKDQDLYVVHMGL